MLRGRSACRVAASVGSASLCAHAKPVHALHLVADTHLSLHSLPPLEQQHPLLGPITLSPRAHTRRAFGSPRSTRCSRVQRWSSGGLALVPAAVAHTFLHTHCTRPPRVHGHTPRARGNLATSRAGRSGDALHTPHDATRRSNCSASTVSHPTTLTPHTHASCQLRACQRTGGRAGRCTVIRARQGRPLLCAAVSAARLHTRGHCTPPRLASGMLPRRAHATDGCTAGSRFPTAPQVVPPRSTHKDDVPFWDGARHGVASAEQDTVLVWNGARPGAGFGQTRRRSFLERREAVSPLSTHTRVHLHGKRGGTLTIFL